MRELFHGPVSDFPRARSTGVARADARGLRNEHGLTQVRLDREFIEEHHKWCSPEESSIPPNDDHMSALTRRCSTYVWSTDVHGCAVGIMHSKTQCFLTAHAQRNRERARKDRADVAYRARVLTTWDAPPRRGRLAFATFSCLTGYGQISDARHAAPARVHGPTHA